MKDRPWYIPYLATHQYVMHGETHRRVSRGHLSLNTPSPLWWPHSSKFKREIPVTFANTPLDTPFRPPSSSLMAMTTKDRNE